MRYQCMGGEWRSYSTSFRRTLESVKAYWSLKRGELNAREVCNPLQLSHLPKSLAKTGMHIRLLPLPVDLHFQSLVISNDHSNFK